MSAKQKAHSQHGHRAFQPAPQVLVLTDQKVDPDGLDVLVEDAGYRVGVAFPDAFTAAGVVAGPPGIVVANLSAQDPRLLNFVEQLNSMLSVMAPPIIVVTGGHDNEEALKHILELGVRDVITKPLLPALLRVKIAQHYRMPLDIGQSVGAYRLKSLLGRGGMSSVYAADRDGLEVALKVVHAKTGDLDASAVARFRREAEVLQRLDGRGAPLFFEMGRAGSVFFFAMERVQGEPLQERLSHSGALGEKEVRELLIDLGAALDAIHAQGIVHRDVKPGNIMVTSSGAAKLIDFGLAKAPSDHSLTTSQVLLGTVAYLAPEVVGGGSIGPGADAFALGMTAFEAALGMCPMKGTPFEIMTALETGVIPDPKKLLRTMSPSIRRTIGALLAPDVRARLRPEDIAASLDKRG